MHTKHLTVSTGCLVLAWAVSGCSTGTPAPEGPALTSDDQAALDAELQAEAGKADGFGWFFYESRYVNTTMAGRTATGDFALVAGSHAADFPYWETRPWDNGLLLVGGEGYHFTHRVQGEALTLDVALQEQASTTVIHYGGTMTRASDGASVAVEIYLPASLTRFEARHLGKPYVVLDLDWAGRIPGMRWQPFELRADDGFVAIDGVTTDVTAVHGELEHGLMANLKGSGFAFAYDYVALARPGDQGYAFVDFVSRSLYPDTVLGGVMDWYLARSATATVTLSDGLTEGNAHGVHRPAQDDPTVVLFESEVDLGLANLRRQMVSTTDAGGRTVYGLREIFEAY